MLSTVPAGCRRRWTGRSSRLTAADTAVRLRPATLPRMRRRGMTVLARRRLRGRAADACWSWPGARCRTSQLEPGPTVQHPRARTTTARTSSRSTERRPPTSAGPAAVRHRRGRDRPDPARGAASAGGSDDDAVVPRELIYPPDQTEQQVEQAEQARTSPTRSQRRDGRADQARLPGAGRRSRRSPTGRRPTASSRPAT